MSHCKCCLQSGTTVQKDRILGRKLRIEAIVEWMDIGLVGIGIAIGLVIYRFVSAKKPVTLESVTAAAIEFPDLAARVESSVQIAVNAIEQGRREIAAGHGAQIYTTSDEMANEVINFVKEFVPQVRGTSNESITKFIKSAVLVASTMTNTIAAAKATVAEAAKSDAINVSALIPPPIVIRNPLPARATTPSMKDYG